MANDLSLSSKGVVLLLEDDPDDQFIFQELVHELGAAVPPLIVVEHSAKAARLLKTKQVIACFVDFRLGAESGLDFIRENTPLYPEVPFMLLTGQGGASIDEEALQAGAKDYLKKSELNSEQLLRCLRYVITQSRHETFIRIQRDRVNELLNSMGEVLWVYNLSDKVFDEIGEGISSITGYSPADFFERPTLWMDLLDEQDQIRRIKLLEAIDTDQLHEIEYVLWDREENKHNVRERIKRIAGHDGTEVLVGVSRDVTQEKASISELKLLQEVIFQLNDSVLITDAILDDPEGPFIVFANPAFIEMSGYTLEELLGKSPKILQGPKTDKEVVLRLKRNLSKGEGFHGEAINYKKDGTEYIANWGIAPVRNPEGEIKYFASVQRDMTEERLKDREVQRDQRLESFGGLAGGIAHDLNNILSPILMGAEMLESIADHDCDHERIVSISKSIINSTQRAAELVGKLLSFAKGKDSEKNYVSLTAVVLEVYKIASETFPKNIELRLSISDDLWVTHSNTTDIQQVLLNLCINTKDSMEENEKGILNLSAENRVLKPDEVEGDTLEEEGPYLCLKVTDNGTGISPEVLGKIYDPFFTTKKEGKGTGLGLSSSFGIIKRHQGNIKVESELGKGTTFSVFLPAKPNHKLDEAEKPKGFSQGKGQRIMVVDDESMNCNLICDILEHNGYQSQGLSSSTEAVKLFSSDTQSFDAVLSDMMMPNIDGLELFKLFRTLRPEVPFLIMSGFTNHGKIDELKKEGITHILSKPVSLENLMQDVNALFDK